MHVLMSFPAVSLAVLLSNLSGQEPGQERTFELIDGMNITMVWIPPGEFDMGDLADKVDWIASYARPFHRVSIRNGFWMSKYEVTQGQWEAVVGDNPAHGYGVGANHPVYDVSWNDIQAFLGQTNSGFRLPSEAEWEYAARAGTQTRFYWGDDPGYPEIGNYAVYGGNSSVSTGTYVSTAEVGTKAPNAWGLYDMSGNVWEWVEDDWHHSYIGAPDDGTAWTDDPRATQRVLRGGSFFMDPMGLRAFYRDRDPPEYEFVYIGFRVVWSLAGGQD